MGKRKRKIIGTPERPRLSVYKANRHIYAQVIEDYSGKTLAAASTLKLDLKIKSNKEAAKKVGAEIAKAAKAAGVTKVVFDRGKIQYHGRIAALAQAAREGGLNF
ncbi:50S ribosomal protein L18 [Candidatus Margulisiibacteriota bacterium]